MTNYRGYYIDAFILTARQILTSLLNNGLLKLTSRLADIFQITRLWKQAFIAPKKPNTLLITSATLGKP